MKAPLDDPARLLARDARRLRWACIVAIAAGFAWCSLGEPARSIRWLPVSGGSASGLPCVLCGGTRAMHQLLSGHFSAAAYYNWLAFPAAIGGVGLIFLFTAELMFGRKLWPRRWRIAVTARTVGAGFALLAGCWVLQVWLAISQHKTELLNPAGPLYSIFVR